MELTSILVLISMLMPMSWAELAIVDQRQKANASPSAEDFVQASSVCPPSNSKASNYQPQVLLSEIKSKTLNSLEQRVTADVPPPSQQTLSRYRHWLGVLNAFQLPGGRGSSGAPEFWQKGQTAQGNSLSLPNLSYRWPKLIELNESEKSLVKSEVLKAYKEAPLKRTTSDSQNIAWEALRKKASEEINFLTRSHPSLPFYTQRDVGFDAHKLASAMYKTQGAKEIEYLRNMGVDSSQAESLVLFSSVGQILADRPELCSTYHTLLEKHKKDLNQRGNLALAVGLGGAAACMAGSLVTGGFIGGLCLAASSMGSGAASIGDWLQTRNESMVLAGGVLNSDVDTSALAEKEKQATAHRQAGALGVAGAAMPFAKLPQAAQKLEKGAETAVARGAKVEPALARGVKPQNLSPADVSEAMAKYPTVAKKIDKMKDEVLAYDMQVPQEGMNKLGALRELSRRGAPTDDVPEVIQDTASAIFLKLNDKKAVAEWSENLAQESLAHMNRNAVARTRAVTPNEFGGAGEYIPNKYVTKQDLLKDGMLDRHSLTSILVRRAQESGERIGVIPNRGNYNGNSTKNWRFDRFHLVPEKGPFFDNKFGRHGAHGQDIHLVQMDIVRSEIHRATNGKPEVFWNFVANDPRGAKLWDNLFDSFQRDFTSPEQIGPLLRRHLPVH